MYEICIGENNIFTLFAFNFRGSPTGIDIIKIAESGITPVLDTGAAHKVAGKGQVLAACGSQGCPTRPQGHRTAAAGPWRAAPPRWARPSSPRAAAPPSRAPGCGREGAAEGARRSGCGRKGAAKKDGDVPYLT